MCVQLCMDAAAHAVAAAPVLARLLLQDGEARVRRRAALVLVNALPPVFRAACALDSLDSLESLDNVVLLERPPLLLHQIRSWSQPALVQLHLRTVTMV